LFSETFDLSVFQKTQTAETAPGQEATTTDAVEFITIKDCRFNRKSAGINKRGILVETLGFVGVLGNDDSFGSSNSGDDDLS
jgi:hypothetical protein